MTLVHRFLSPGKSHASFAFPKGSPLLPFFRHAYNKIRQTGALHRHSKKWRTEDQPTGCDSKNLVTPISFNKIISLLALVLLGISLASITSLCENMHSKMARGRKMEWDVNKIEEEGNSQTEQRKKYSEESE